MNGKCRVDLCYSSALPGMRFCFLHLPCLAVDRYFWERNEIEAFENKMHYRRGALYEEAEELGKRVGRSVENDGAEEY